MSSRSVRSNRLIMPHGGGSAATTPGGAEPVSSGSTFSVGGRVQDPRAAAGGKRFGAEGGTRTPTGCPTRPSNVRVCQFRHFGELRGESIALSRATDNSADALAQPRIERVANALTEKVV